MNIVNRLKNFFQKAFKMTDEPNIGEAILAVALGILGGIALAKIIEWAIGARCPVCKRPIDSDIRKCPYCNTALRWR